MSKLINTRAAYATIAAVALAAGLAGVSYAGSDNDADKRAGQATATDASSPQLSMSEVLTRLRTAGYSDIREIEREKGRYEVKGRDAEGYRVELYLDARTGEVIKEERDD